MRTTFVIPATTGTYVTDAQNVTDLTAFGAWLSFEFYNDEECTEVSEDVTGTLTINGKFTENSIWQNIPVTDTPSSLDCSDPKSIFFNGVVYRFQLITLDIANTNFIKISVDRQYSF